MKPGDRLLAYFALAFGISWSAILLIGARTGLPAPAQAAQSYRLLAFVAMLAGPTLGSIGLTAALDRRRGLHALAGRLVRPRIGGRWYVAVAFAPGLLLVLLGALSLVSPEFRPGLITSGSPAAISAMAMVAGLGAGLFEELGWTGFATPRLLSRLGWLRAGVALGIVWGAWHALPDFWGGVSYGPLWGLHMLEWLVALTAFRVLMTWAYHHTGSLLLAVFLHASFTGGQALLWPSNASPRAELLWYGLFAAALWLAAAAVAVYERAAEWPPHSTSWRGRG